MLKNLSLLLALVLSLVMASDALAKKTRTAPADPPAETKDKNDDKSSDKADKDDAETHKVRAKAMENGKPVDKAKTAEGIDKITSQVNALDAALKNNPGEKEPQLAKGRKGRPATRPTTQPTTKESIPAKEQDAPAPTSKKK